MKLRLTALLLYALMFCMLLSSCSLVLLTPDSSSVSSVESYSENVEVSSETESSEVSSNDEASGQISSQNQSFVNKNNSSKNNSSKAQNSSSKQNSSQKKPDQNTVAMPLRPIRPDEYYGWQYLNTYASETVQKAYQVFVEKFGNYEKKIKFDFNITGEEARLAFDCYKSDYPQHFWVRDASYRSSSKTGYVHEFILIKIPFNGKMDKVQELEIQMLQEAKKVLSKVNGSMSALERERIIHDSLVENTIYDISGKAENSHNLCGPLVDGTAVCEGYANAFQYLVRQAGVQCIPIKGVLNGDKHEWNMVKLGGEYYHVDVTADDPIINGGETQILKFDYFNLPQSEIEKDHTIENNAYDIPNAMGTKYNFFEVYELGSEGVNTNFVAKAMAFSVNNGYEYAHMRFSGVSIDEAVMYIAENYNAILNRANQSITGKMLVSGQNIDYSHDAAKGILSIKLKYE